MFVASLYEVSVQAMKAYVGGSCVAPLISNLGEEPHRYPLPGDLWTPETSWTFRRIEKFLVPVWI
jgi:hypothetical protein